jgi:prepilin-type processing-associated H-X9-DG protein/prepilin-type N-terminal cleavage/methylation domain-containing protein
MKKGIFRRPPLTPARHRRDCAGLTLIELLVVVAIILLLAGLLLAGVRGARQRADTAYCLNHQRQLALAWTLYSQDYDDRLVPNLDGEPGPRTNWIGGSMAEPSQATNRLLLADPGRSLLAPYFRDPALLRCPADESDHVRSVALNCRMNPVRRDNLPPRWVSGGGAKYATFHKLGEVQRPAEVFVFVDEAETSINDGYFAVDHSHTGDPDGQGAARPYYLIDYPAVRHGGGATFGFADGHAAAKRWRDPATLRQTTPRTHVGPRNADARWLLEHATHER